MKKQYRYAFYLIPPYQISRDITEIHLMLKKQYGICAAGRFQVHCTIKGFFKPNEKSLKELIRNLDAFLNTQKPFTVELSDCKTKPKSIFLRLDEIDGIPNQKLLDFRESIVELVRPFIASDCDFYESDLIPPFKGHITLAFKDLSDELYPQILEWLKNAPLPEGKFQAENFQFLEFFSQDWNGNWWETISWKLLKSWRLNA